MAARPYNTAFTQVANGNLAPALTLAIGDPNATRWVIPVAAMTCGSVTRVFQSLKVNDVDAFITNGSITLTTGSYKQVFHFGRPIYVPDGTTATMSATIDKVYNRLYMGLVAVTGITAASLRRIASKGGTDTGAGGLALDTYENGLTLAMALMEGLDSSLANAVPFAWSGVDTTPAYDQNFTNKGRGSFRTFSSTAAETGHNIAAVMSAANPYGLAAVAYSFDDDTSTPSTVKVTDLLQNHVVQRNLGTRLAALPVKATYTGTVANKPTSVQARVMRGTAVIVDWTTLDSPSIAGGFISGTLPNVPVGFLGYSLEVRTYAGATLLATAAGTTTWSVGDNYGIIGSSTGSQFGSPGPSSIALPANAYRMVYSGSSPGWSTNIGTYCRLMAQRLQAVDPTIPIGFMDFAITGSRLEEWTTANSAQRAPMIDFVQTYGEGRIAGIIMPFLESDSVPDIPTDLARFRLLLSQIRGSLNQPALQMLTNVSGPKDFSVGSATNTYMHTQATIQFQDDPGVTVGCFRDGALGSGDAAHMDDPSLQIMAARVGVQLAAALLGSSRPYKPPQAISQTYNAATGAVDIKFDLRGAGSLVGKTSQSGITGFRAATDATFATRLTISSAVIVAADVVRLMIAEKPAAVPTVDYFFDRLPDTSNCLGSNASIAA